MLSKQNISFASNGDLKKTICQWIASVARITIAEWRFVFKFFFSVAWMKQKHVILLNNWYCAYSEILSCSSATLNRLMEISLNIYILLIAFTYYWSLNVIDYVPPLTIIIVLAIRAACFSKHSQNYRNILNFIMIIYICKSCTNVKIYV